ncbi:MAG TPA: hypothetical protein EYP49_20610, partial [Anaerolineae bacterium]|nr:hypothetical protein [Anaerolineae bacterium]
MARKETRKESLWKKLNTTLQPFQREIVGLLVLALAGITLLGLFSVTSGTLSAWWIMALRRFFGWGAYLVAMGLVAIGMFLLLTNLEQKWKPAWRTIIGLEVIFIGGLALVHLLSFSQDPWHLAMSGKGGGLIGWVISRLLISTLGVPIALLILLVLLSAGIAMTIDLSRISIQKGVVTLVARALSLYEGFAPPAESAPWPVEEPKKPPAEAAVGEPAVPVSTAKPQGEVKLQKRQKSRAPGKRKTSLPSLDLLSQFPTQAFSQEQARRRARIIEETLASFGVPARVVEINQGPVVTQFGVKPGYTETIGPDGELRRRKVRVSKITSLANDLALALAASPIRIEAPVPGRPIIGIEVPNEDISLVSLREVMGSKEFR